MELRFLKSLLFKNQTAASIPTPASGELAFFAEGDTAKIKTSAGMVVDLGAAGGGGGSPGGVSGQMQYNNAGAFAGATNITVESNNLALVDTTSPAAVANKSLIYSVLEMGRSRLRVHPSGSVNDYIQGRIGGRQCGRQSAVGANGTVVNAFGQLPALTATGTATGTQNAVTNRATATNKVQYLVTTAAATAVAGPRIGSANVFVRGNAANIGGFYILIRGGIATGTATASRRAFFGLSTNSAAPTDVDPTTLLNILGFGYNAALANWHFMSNDGTATAAVVDLGANFAKPTTDNSSLYTFELYCRPNGTTIHYRATNEINGAVASGSVTTKIPANTQYQTFNSYVSAGGTSSVIGMNFCELYYEMET